MICLTPYDLIATAVSGYVSSKNNLKVTIYASLIKKKKKKYS